MWVFTSDRQMRWDKTKGVLFSRQRSSAKCQFEQNIHDRPFSIACFQSHINFFQCKFRSVSIAFCYNVLKSVSMPPMSSASRCLQISLYGIKDLIPLLSPRNLYCIKDLLLLLLSNQSPTTWHQRLSPPAVFTSVSTALCDFHGVQLIIMLRLM